MRRTSAFHMAVGKTNGSNLVGGVTTHFSRSFSGDWDVHWGYGLLTHGHIKEFRGATPYSWVKKERSSKLNCLELDRRFQSVPFARATHFGHLFLTHTRKKRGPPIGAQIKCWLLLFCLERLPSKSHPGAQIKPCHNVFFFGEVFL